MYSSKSDDRYYVVRTDVENPLSAYSRFGFELDGAEWPSVEHYYQGMKFEEGELRESVRTAEHPEKAKQLAEARNQLKMAELLGYGTKKSFKPMYEEIKQIEQQTAGGKGGKGWFDKIKQQLSDLI